MEDDRGASCTIFVGGLPLEATEDDLMRLAGADSFNCKVNIPQENNKPNNKASFGFLTVPQRVAQRLLTKDQYVLGRKVDCQPAISRSEKHAYHENLSRCKVFVDNLPFAVDEKELRKGLRKHGTVRFFYTTTKNDSMHKICIAEYSRSRDANSSIRNGLMYMKKYYRVMEYHPPKGQETIVKNAMDLRAKREHNVRPSFEHYDREVFNKPISQLRSQGPPKHPRNSSKRDHVLEWLKDINHEVHVKFDPKVEKPTPEGVKPMENYMFNIREPQNPGGVYKKVWYAGMPVYSLQKKIRESRDDLSSSQLLAAENSTLKQKGAPSQGETGSIEPTQMFVFKRKA